MTKENPGDYGAPKKQGRVKGFKREHATKKDIAEGLVLTAEDIVKTSVDTPDPHVTSIGDTTDTEVAGTVTGRANTTTSGPTAPTTTTRSTTSSTPTRTTTAKTTTTTKET